MNPKKHPEALTATPRLHSLNFHRQSTCDFAQMSYVKPKLNSYMFTRNWKDVAQVLKSFWCLCWRCCTFIDTGCPRSRCAVLSLSIWVNFNTLGKLETDPECIHYLGLKLRASQIRKAPECSSDGTKPFILERSFQTLQEIVSEGLAERHLDASKREAASVVKGRCSMYRGHLTTHQSSWTTWTSWTSRTSWKLQQFSRVRIQ